MFNFWMLSLIMQRRAVLEDSGKVMAASKLTIQQLRAELEARQLMVDGSRKEMYKRVQVCAFTSNSLSPSASFLRTRCTPADNLICRYDG